jgi:hypothetical protein
MADQKELKAGMRIRVCDSSYETYDEYGWIQEYSQSEGLFGDIYWYWFVILDSYDGLLGFVAETLEIIRDENGFPIIRPDNALVIWLKNKQ